MKTSPVPLSEFELRQKAQDGERARQLLKDPMLQGALRKMRETIFYNIQTSHWKDAEEREELYKQLKAIDAFEKEFTALINGGKKAESKLKQLLDKVRNNDGQPKRSHN